MRRSKHDLSHYKLTTFDAGELVPVACMEVLPGDTFRHASAVMLRVSPMVSPVMHPVSVRLAHWYVPNRIIWQDWERFILDEPGAPALPVATVTVGGAPVGGLFNHLGLPSGALAVATPVNQLPLRAYNSIYNNHYRREDIEPTPVAESSQAMQRVMWERDYFVSATVAPQTGAGATVPVLNPAVLTSPVPINTVTGVLSVEALRAAQMLQRIRERRNRGGLGYDDLLRFYGVPVSDARISDPEFLGASSQTISFSEVLATNSGAGLGSMGGHGIAALRVPPYRRFFPEHGYVMSLLSVRPKAIYASVLDKHWRRLSFADFYQPESEFLGDEPIQNTEVAFRQATSPGGTFGWTPRNNSYRQVHSSVSGEFETTKKDWHFAREFTSQPVLNSSFIRSTPVKTPFADQVADPFQAMVVHTISAKRMVSKKGMTDRAI